MYPSQFIYRSGIKRASRAEEAAVKTLTMDLTIKLLQSPGGGNHLIIIAGGLIDLEGLERILRMVTETAESLLHCKVVIDFGDAHLRLVPPDLYRLVNELAPDLRQRVVKIALLSSAEVDASVQLSVLTDALHSENLRVAIFDNARDAVAWII
jgi:hypothetical protein